MTRSAASRIRRDRASQMQVGAARSIYGLAISIPFATEGTNALTGACGNAKPAQER
jgi:hypothetical protein